MINQDTNYLTIGPAYDKVLILFYMSHTYRLFIILLLFYSCREKVFYFDDDFPGLEPKVYARGIINIEDRFLQNLTMSPDGKEVLLGETDSTLWRYERILRVKLLEQGKVQLDTPEFVKNFQYERTWMIGEPMISRDNQTLYFVADYPPDYWSVPRKNNGDWGIPVKMEAISTDEADWYISTSNMNTLYFTNGRIYKSPLMNGENNSRIKVEGAFNQLDAGDPSISQDESYMIFASTREGGFGQGDIYVCFKSQDGQWSKAYNLGGPINTEYWESAPFISPDEKFLFFSRRDRGQHAGFQKIYWVSMDVVKNIKNIFDKDQ